MRAPLKRAMSPRCDRRPSPAMPERGRKCGYVDIAATRRWLEPLQNKLAIVTPKVQTTRSRLLGIATDNDAQLIVVDTPGIFEPRRRLDRAMVAAAWAGASDADVSVLLVDAARGIDDDTPAYRRTAEGC